MRSDVFLQFFPSKFDDLLIFTSVHLFFINIGNMLEGQITENIPFNGNFYRFVVTLHGLKGVVDILVYDAHNCP